MWCGRNAAFDYELGLLVESATSLKEILGKLLTGFPAFYSLNQAGKFTLREITAPAGAGPGRPGVQRPH